MTEKKGIEVSDMNKKWYWGIAAALILFGGLILGFAAQSPEENDNYEEAFKKDYSIYAPPIPDTLYFAGERVPVENFDTRESLDRELLVNTYWQSQTVLFIKRSARYFPIIEPILEENGVPEDFKYLAIAESGLLHVTSPAGAVGFWQFLRGTGREYGLEINSEVDERYHIEKATEAACKYLKKAYDHYNSWTLAAASFNNGRNGLNKQIDRQNIANYYDLLLNDETERYVFRILAIKLILSNPQKYGFHIREKDMYQPLPTYTVEVDSSIDDFASFADNYGINYKILKFFNPWLRRAHLTNSEEKTYEIKLPTDDLPRQFSSGEKPPAEGK